LRASSDARYEQSDLVTHKRPKWGESGTYRLKGVELSAREILQKVKVFLPNTETRPKASPVAGTGLRG